MSNINIKIPLQQVYDSVACMRKWQHRENLLQYGRQNGNTYAYTCDAHGNGVLFLYDCNTNVSDFDVYVNTALFLKVYDCIINISDDDVYM
jgi:hypothetical protein